MADVPARVLDAGDTGCGELVLALSVEMRKLAPGELLEVRSSDPGVPADLPAWARMTGHAFEGELPPAGRSRRFLLRKGPAR
jgi:tRNA 2-thiouridine synthesizing protein A